LRRYNFIVVAAFAALLMLVPAEAAVDRAQPAKPQCRDQIDNDGDGKIDYPADPGCVNRNDNDETDPPPPPGCPESTAALQSLIDATPDGGTVSLTAGACYGLSGTLYVGYRTNLTIDGNGATLQNGVGDGHRPIFLVDRGTGNRFIEMTIDGGYGNPGVHDPNVQWSHGIELKGADAVTVDGITVRDVAGDCVYVGGTSFRTTNTLVRNVICDGTGRQGVSVVAANNTRVEGGTWSLIGWIAFDVEPNDTGGANGVDGAVFTGAMVTGYYLDVGTIIGQAPVANVTWSSLTITAPKGGRFRALPSGAWRRSNITISGNSASATVAGDAVYLENVDGATVANNSLPNSGFLLRCFSVTSLTFSGNTPSTSSGC
jgi:hypothetical protein